MKTILLISGSQRRSSLNTRLLYCVSAALANTYAVEMLEPHRIELPLFNQDLEDSPEVILHAADLHARIKASDGIIVASPEYNGQVSPFLKNTVDWISRLAYIDPAFDNAFLDRPLLLCSASSGAGGGALGLQSARALFSYVGCLLPGDSICLPYADQLLNEEGYKLPPQIKEQITFSVTRFAQLVERMARPQTGGSSAARVDAAA